MTTPAKESVAERRVSEWWDARHGPGTRLKLNVQGNRGWPDQMYMIPGGRPFYIEFKRKGEVPRELQKYIHGILKERGYDVEVHDDSEQAICAIQKRLGGSDK